jgi:hypothetical protein
MATRMQQRRGTAQQWTDADPRLESGEIGFETDTNQFKIGDGVNDWSDLSYFKNLEDLGGSLDDYALANLIGAANGIASLDATGQIPITQLANIIDGAPELLNTLDELAAAINDNAGFANTVLTSVSSAQTAAEDYADNAISIAVTSHNDDTTNVHGIANTAVLAVKSELEALSNTISNAYATAIATSASTTLTAYSLADSTHANTTANVHGIADTSVLATATTVATAKSEAITAAANAAATALSTHESDTTNIHGIANTAALATTANVATAKSEAISDAGTAADTKVSTAVAALTKSSVGLANVDNTADSAKPVSTAQSNAIATAKAEAIADATSQVNALLTGAPAALNTLDELAAALGDDANFASTVTTSLGLKAPLASPTFTGTVTVAASGIAFTDGTQTKEGVPSRTPIIAKTASYTLSALTERDSLIEVANASATTITIPTNATVAYPVGTSIDILQTSTGQVTIAGAGGVTVNATPGLKLRTQWSGATLFKRATDTWVVYGDLSA